MHNQYKTPSPYRNNEMGLQQNMMGLNPNNLPKNPRFAGQPNLSDPFYPSSYGLQN